MTAAFEKSEIRYQAENVASRVPESVGIDPLTIITILTQILPLLSNCGMKRSSAKPEDIRAYVTDRYNAGDRARESLRKSIARRVRGEADHPLSKEQSLIIADAIIEETMYPCSDDNALALFTAECAALDPSV